MQFIVLLNVLIFYIGNSTDSVSSFRLLERDPFHIKCTLVHLAAAMELGKSNELYIMACNLVKDYPQK